MNRVDSKIKNATPEEIKERPVSFHCLYFDLMNGNLTRLTKSNTFF